MGHDINPQKVMLTVHLGKQSSWTTNWCCSVCTLILGLQSGNLVIETFFTVLTINTVVRLSAIISNPVTVFSWACFKSTDPSQHGLYLSPACQQLPCVVPTISFRLVFFLSGLAAATAFNDSTASPRSLLHIRRSKYFVVLQECQDLRCSCWALGWKNAAVGNFVRRRRGSGSARVSPTLHGWRRGSCCILHHHHFLPNQSGILIKMDWGFYGCRNWTQVDAFLAKPSAICVWFKRCPLIGCGPELVRSMPAPTQRQLLADGFMKQGCIIIIRELYCWCHP